MKFVKKVKKFVKKKKLVAKVLVLVAVVKFLADFVDVVGFLTKLWEFIGPFLGPIINLCDYILRGEAQTSPLLFSKVKASQFNPCLK